MNNILIVCGGNSVEHEISIITATQLIKKYDGKYKLHLCYLKDGTFYYIGKPRNHMFFKSYKKHKKISFKANKNSILVGLKKIFFEGIYLCVHGINCEDGTLYGYFKTLNINILNEDVYSASVGQDKTVSKKLTNVPSLPYFYVSRHVFSNNLKSIIEFANKYQYPLIIKPNKLGSSVGVFSVNNVDELVEKIEFVFHICDSVVIEKQLKNFEELNIALIKYKSNIIVSEIEKVSNSKVLSYQDKYVNSNKSMVGQDKELPANISKKLKDEIIKKAKTIYTDLNASGIVRIDFLYDTDNKKLYFNEINNIPGSLATYLFEKANIPINDLIDMLFDEGLFVNELNKNLITTYEKNIFTEKTLYNVKFNK